MQQPKTDDRIGDVRSDPREDLRLSALNELDILDTPREEAFDRIARLIRYVFEVPVAFAPRFQGAGPKRGEVGYEAQAAFVVLRD
jgi:hypothetical protein